MEMSDDDSHLNTSPFISDAESQPLHENLMEELPQSDQQQLIISKLQKELKELRRQVSGKQSRIPIQSLVDQGSKSAKKIRNLGRLYGYVKNILLRPSEFTPSKYTKKFRLEKRFGSHLCEGNFRELLDWLPERCQNLLTEDPSFFGHHFLKGVGEVRRRGICKLQKGFVLEKIFSFYRDDDGISIHSYPEANKLLGNEMDQGYPPNCPLVFPPGHDMTNGDNNLILRSPYIIKVICWLLLSGAYPESDGPTTLKSTAWENRPSNTVAAKRWGINKVTPGLICCAAVFAYFLLLPDRKWSSRSKLRISGISLSGHFNFYREMLEEGLDRELKGASRPGVLPYHNTLKYYNDLIFGTEEEPEETASPLKSTNQVDPYEAFRQRVRRQWELESQNMGSEDSDNTGRNGGDGQSDAERNALSGGESGGENATSHKHSRSNAAHSDTTPSVPAPRRSPRKANHTGLQVHQSPQLGRRKAVSFEEPVTPPPPKRRKTKDMVQNLTRRSTRSSRVVD